MLSKRGSTTNRGDSCVKAIWKWAYSIEINGTGGVQDRCIFLVDSL